MHIIKNTFPSKRHMIKHAHMYIKHDWLKNIMELSRFKSCGETSNDMA